eukprot:TRINITY_DN1423_c0_g4_i1.p1 TRINITY_DN1423_c0_g4~~TRINITY_DN1423_c0_g4_i1.p1  ORF type:complete len:871 (+),score=245.44 TRINITY_DN1423_c0_g4_i1:61-2673(+)
MSAHRPAGVKPAPPITPPPPPPAVRTSRRTQLQQASSLPSLTTARPTPPSRQAPPSPSPPPPPLTQSHAGNAGSSNTPPFETASGGGDHERAMTLQLHTLANTAALAASAVAPSKMVFKLWGGGGNKAVKSRFSLAHLRQLCATLQGTFTITEETAPTLVEAMRDLAEVVIWGDQHDPTFFECFMEKSILTFFFRVLSEQSKEAKEVKTQVLQTLSILIENTKTPNSLYFLLSNNHVNRIITMGAQFNNEEMLGYYISFLKTLALKLDVKSLNFFFNEKEQSFPLFTEALKFYNHNESMVRIAVRILTLTVFKLEHPGLRAFLTSSPQSQSIKYFSDVVLNLRHMCSRLDDMLIAGNKPRATVDLLFSEILDNMLYLQDVINVGIAVLNDHICRVYLTTFVLPQLAASVLPDAVLEDRLTPANAVFLLAATFYAFKYAPLVNTLGNVLFHPCPAYPIYFLVLSANPGAATLPPKNAFRDALLCSLGNNDTSLISTVLLVCAVSKNNAVSKKLLAESGLMPTLVPVVDDAYGQALLPLPKAVVRLQATFPSLSLFTLHESQQQQPQLCPEAQSLRWVRESQTFFEALFEELFAAVLNGFKYRLRTLQMTVLLVKLLGVNRSEYRLRIEAALDKTLGLLKSNAAQFPDVFLELFEEVLVRFRPITFERTLQDVSVLLPDLPPPIDATKVGAAEAAAVRKTMEVFLVLRDLSLHLFQRKEDVLPLAFPAFPKIFPGDPLPIGEDPSMLVMEFLVPQLALKKPHPHLLVVRDESLIVCEVPVPIQQDKKAQPDRRLGNSDPPAGGASKVVVPKVFPTKTAVVESVCPLQSIEVRVLESQASVLQVTSTKTKCATGTPRFLAHHTQVRDINAVQG